MAGEYSGKIAVNTESINQTVGRLQNSDKNISAEFEKMKKSCIRLENEWNSKAGSKACTVMHQLFKNGEIRSTVMNNYINFLSQMVNPNYISAETTNKSLADSFK